MDKPLLFLTILLLVGSYIFATPEIPLEAVSLRLITIQGNTLSPVSNPNYVRPLYHPEVLACLSFYESSHNPDAKGAAGECGQLQFMPATFQYFCVEQYGLPDDIWNTETQFKCADRMLEAGLEKHWTTWDKCY